MKILFVSNNHDINMGSYRIWVHDLNLYFRECGIDSRVQPRKQELRQSDFDGRDVIICAKSDTTAAIQIKKAFPNKKVGIINLSADKKDLPIDFIIAGSLEEMDSLSHYDNVFLYPLIEKTYQNKMDYKMHSPVDILRIGFHGHYPHLSKFEPNLKNALEKFNDICKIELLVITGNPEFKWKHGRPNVDIVHKPWSLETIKNDLLSCDVGIVPNVTYLNTENLPTSIDRGLYNTDYILRFKNKSNAGRCFVFHQLGIPIIADFTPSNFHILGDLKSGFVAHNENSWFKALMKLRDHKLRQKVADNAKMEFDRLYSPHDWATRLYKNILEINNE